MVCAPEPPIWTLFRSITPTMKLPKTASGPLPRRFVSFSNQRETKSALGAKGDVTPYPSRVRYNSKADISRNHMPTDTLSFSQLETFAPLIDWYLAAEPQYGSRLRRPR